MALATAKIAIRTAVAARVQTALSVPCWFENEIDNARPDSVHCEIEIRVNETEQVSSGGTGTRRYRILGEVRFQTFVPIGVGEKILDTTLDGIESAFRGVTIDSVVFSSPVSRRRGRVDRWFASFTACPFYYDYFA